MKVHRPSRRLPVKLALPLATLAGLTIFLVDLSGPGPWNDGSALAAPQMAACRPDDYRMDAYLAELKASHFVFSPAYGWFDTTHLEAGNPRQIIADVRAAAANGGDVVAISQGLENDLTGYTAYYWVSGHLHQRDVIGVALGIYMDWSIRFEAWQGEPPRSLAAPLTSFAIDDLPSHYIGFFAATRNLSPIQVMLCYLGEVAPTELPPPAFAIQQTELAGAEANAAVTRLTNHEFRPLVKTEDGWRHVAWPEAMHLTAVPAGRQTWQYLEDETWYFQ